MSTETMEIRPPRAMDTMGSDALETTTNATSLLADRSISERSSQGGSSWKNRKFCGVANVDVVVKSSHIVSNWSLLASPERLARSI